MFESIKNLKYARYLKQIELCYQFCLRNATFKCRYCNKELGYIETLQVTDFLNHLQAEHGDKIITAELAKFQNLMDKLKR